MITYPSGPCPPECQSPKKIEYTDPKTGKKVKKTMDLRMFPGEGIFAQPFESLKYLDLEFPMGTGSGVYISMMFQLGKWAYARHEVKHTIEVSPVYKEYYALIMEQKEKLDNQIRSGFAGLIQAVQDFELIEHDLRKYKEYLDWFVKFERAKKKYEKAKKIKKSEEIEKTEKEYKESQHVIKSMFIDQVDAHTGEGVSLRGIAPRWPTIIADFMDLYDEDISVNDIQKRLDVPRAEAIVLKTKNELYRYWKETFLTNIISRYSRLKQLALGRKFSIEDTRKDLIPLISRFKSIKDARAGMSEAAKATYNWSRLDAQAIALDDWEVWAWKPFVMKQEPFPNSRIEEGGMSFREAGFNREEIKILKDNGVEGVPAMPAFPIMDRHLRNIIKMIHADHGILLGPSDVVKHAEDIHKRFSTPDPYKSNVQTGADSAIPGGPRWEFSPYFIFLRIPIYRYVLKLPNGGMLEDMIWNGMQAFNATQNVIIGHMLEIQAIQEKERREISLLLGYEEKTLTGGVSKLDEILKEEFPEFDFRKGEISEEWLEKEDEKEKKEKKKGLKESFEKFQEKLEKFNTKSKNVLSKLGLNQLMFAYKTPYEKMMYERMSKMMQRGPGVAFNELDNWLKQKGGVPGV